jgi:UDP-2,3-diacylglucosamine pyrophosphatase LpxH
VPQEPGKRGFRLCTHADAIVRFVKQRTDEIAKNGPNEIVLNGDTVDLLAETDPPAPADMEAATWSSFTADPMQAVEKFNAIVSRDPEVFAAFTPYLDVGGRVTVLLGNHDVELSLPDVRRALRKALGVRVGHDFEFIQDGEAYVVGEALIEHGNRYDAWNQIDLDALRRVRSLLSRRQAGSEQYRFGPPAGSQMVTTVINKIKLKYAFVDLLKPETSAAVPLLLALEPSYRKQFAQIARLWYWTRGHGLEGPALPKFGGDIRADVAADAPPFGHDIAAGATDFTGSAQEILGAIDEDAALKGVIADVLKGDAEVFLRQLEGAPARGAQSQIGTDVGARENLDTAVGLFALVFGSNAEDMRLRALLRAMRGMQSQDTFDRHKEGATEYLDAAKRLVKEGGFRYVVFGHTHQAKSVNLGDGRWYFNSGTWADVLEFPAQILTGTDADALVWLRGFVDEMKNGDFSRLTLFTPTYVRFDIGDKGTIEKARLYDALTDAEI